MPKVILLSPPSTYSGIPQRGFARWVHSALPICNMCLTFPKAYSSKCTETNCFWLLLMPVFNPPASTQLLLSHSLYFLLMELLVQSHITSSTTALTALPAAIYLPSFLIDPITGLFLFLFFSLLPYGVAGITGGKELLLEQSWLATQTLRSSTWIRRRSPQGIYQRLGVGQTWEQSCLLTDTLPFTAPEWPAWFHLGRRGKLEKQHNFW